MIYDTNDMVLYDMEGSRVGDSVTQKESSTN